MLGLNNGLPGQSIAVILGLNNGLPGQSIDVIFYARTEQWVTWLTNVQIYVRAKQSVYMTKQ